MDPTTFAIGASVVLALSFAIYQIGKPTPLPLIPHNKLEWFTGDIPFLARQAKEKGSLTFAFDDTARRLGPISQVFEVLSSASIMADISLSVIIGLGASWASRLFGFGQAIVILAVSSDYRAAQVTTHSFNPQDSQEIQDVLVNRAAEFARSKSITALFVFTALR
jgi:hypothetical protein